MTGAGARAATPDLRIVRLRAGERDAARRLVTLLTDVFEERDPPIGDAYLDRLLQRDDQWLLAALDGDDVVGGLVAHVLPLTRTESAELFVYDVAVRADQRRRGVGRRLLTAARALAAAAGIPTVLVPVDPEDAHALAFYRAVGGEAQDAVLVLFDTTRDPPDGAPQP